MGFEVWEGGFSQPQVLISRADCENSATLDLAYVASGAFDIWWEGGCWEW
jgi:fructose-1,6-bisphosphatase/inositol monophosphatase family enzyme